MSDGIRLGDLLKGDPRKVYLSKVYSHEEIMSDLLSEGWGRNESESPDELAKQKTEGVSSIAPTETEGIGLKKG